MSTYTQILYQLVFSTKQREATLTPDREVLYKHIWGILKNKKCHLFRIGGVEDHIHIITSIHPMIAPAALIKDIKFSTSEMIKSKRLFQHFCGWQEGYGAFTYHIEAKNRLIEYVKNQELHHKNVSFREEYMLILKEHNVKFDERYLL